MSPEMSVWMAKAMRAVLTGILSGSTRQNMRETLLALSPAEANIRERAWLADAGLSLWRHAKLWPNPTMCMSSLWMMQRFEHIANQMDRMLQAKAKAQTVGSAVQEARMEGEPFFVVTTHQKPACGHKDIQGKLLIDRYWRSSLERSGKGWLIPSVQRFIAARSIRTVQWAMGKPTYLITRPYCRHRLVNIITYEALTSPPEGIVVLDHAHRSLTDAQRYARYQARRNAIRKGLRKISARYEKTPRNGF